MMMRILRMAVFPAAKRGNSECVAAGICLNKIIMEAGLVNEFECW